MDHKQSFTLEEAKAIGDTLGIIWDRFDVDEFRRGLDMELAHSKSDTACNFKNDHATSTGKIAFAHLRERPDYYTRLAKTEEDAARYWDSYHHDEEENYYDSGSCSDRLN